MTYYSNLRHMRVVAQLNEEPDKINQLMGTQLLAENLPTIQLIDSKTIRLHARREDACTPAITHTLTYDHVGVNSDNFIRSEVSALITEMFQQRRNCALARFSPQRQCHLITLHQALVAVINQRLRQLNCNLQSIEVLCDQIMPDVKQVKDCNSSTPTPSPSPTQTTNNTKTLKGIFRNTKQLLLWLLNDYRHNGTEVQNTSHEALDFVFVLMADGQRAFNVKFSLLNIYWDKMNAEERSNWHKYMEELGHGPNRRAEGDFIPTALTSALSAHFEASNNECRLLLLFDVSAAERHDADVIELLQMAHALVKNRDKENCTPPTRPVHKPLKRLMREAARRLSLSSDCSSFSDYTSTPNSVSFTVPIETEVGRSCKRQRLAPATTLTTKDFQSLSSWYRKIDSKYTEALDSIDTYYESCLGDKIDETSDFIRNILSADLDTNNNFITSHSNNEKSTLKELLTNCQDAVNAFHQLTNEIEFANYKDVLQIYLATKKYELSQFMMQCKMKKLEICRDKFTLTINNELWSLEFGQADCLNE